jgi:hypothetical protein
MGINFADTGDFSSGQRPQVSKHLRAAAWGRLEGGPACERANSGHAAMLVPPRVRAQKTHTNIKGYFPEAGDDVLPAVPGRRAPSDD